MLSAIWTVILQLAPWLLLGAAVAGVLHLLLPAGFVRRHLSGRGGVAKAVLLGAPLPLCSCGVIPMAIGLKKDGATDGATVGFLISTPQTGVDSLMVSGGLLGWPFALFKLASATVMGLVGGGLANLGQPAATLAPTEANKSSDRSPGAAFAHALEILRTIWPWLVVGIVASAAITAWVPESWVLAIGGQSKVLALLSALVISLPLYVCATASVPIAAALVAGGFPTGAALVFLMAGPATNLATMGAIYRALGRRCLAIYLATIVVGSLVLGWTFDFVVAPQVAGHRHEHGAAWWATAAAVALTALLAWFAIDDLRRWMQARQPEPPSAPGETTIELSVGGLTCQGCVRKLETSLRADLRVRAAVVTLEPGRAEVTGELDEPAVRTLVEAAGFSVTAPG